MKLGQSIKLIRLLRGMNQKQFAKMGGTHQGYYSVLERGEREPSTRVLKNLCAGIGVAPSVLMMADEGNHRPLIEFLIGEVS